MSTGGYEATSDYGYIPSKGIVVTFLTLYSISAGLHAVEATYGRLWFLFPTVLLCLTGEIIGWACRDWSIYSDGRYNIPYTAQYVCTIISPTFLLAGYFVLLGRLIGVFGSKYSRLRHHQYVLFFVICDIISLIIQAAGGGMAVGAGNSSTGRIGGWIAFAGIVFQLCSIVFFILLSVEFVFRFHFDKPVRANVDADGFTPSIQNGWPFAPSAVLAAKGQNLENKKLFALDFKLQLLLLGMGISVLCIMIRAIYRTIELSGGFNSNLVRNQLTFDTCDGMMILIASWMLNIFHPSFLFRPSESNTTNLALNADTERGSNESEKILNRF